MPHRPNPIPRYNGSNLPPQSQLHPNTTEVVTSSRREKDGLPPRHRASSGASEPSPNAHASASASRSSNTTAGTTPGGRPSGRALPPPRFQRKQRPPRVQQAIAAAANASSLSNAATNPTPNLTQSGGGRRGAAKKEGASSGQRGGAGTGTLTLGPANNWGAGTSAVVSLSMATINAASARASVVHPPQQPPPPPTIPTFEDAQRMDRLLPPDFLLGVGRAELEGLDPVQLHNRITFGMGRTSTFLRNDLYAPEYIHYPNNYSLLPPNVGGLEQDSYLLSSGAGAGLSGGERDHAATVRARSHSHNHAVHTPSSVVYHPINVAHAKGRTRAFSPIHSSSPYASSFRTETPPMVHAIAPPHQHPGADFDHQLRIRSQSLMAPVESYRQSQSREPLVFPPSLSSHPALPPSQYHQSGLTSAPSNPTQAPARYDSTSSMQAQYHLSLNTDLGNDIHLSGSAPQSASGSGPNRKPLKSALKVRKSAPDLADPGRGSPPPTPGQPGSDGGRDLHAHGHPVTRSQEPTMLPDPGFTLPDESLQAQYAHQLRLLQEEYATKAAKADKSRRSLKRNKVTSGSAVAHGENRNASPAMGREAGYSVQEMVAPPRARMNLDSTPPSSSGGSAGGHRVAFFEEVKVIAQEEMKATDAEQAERDAGGYASWDDEWTGEGDDDITEFVYSSSTGDDAGSGGIVERRGVDSELSPGTETSELEDDGGSDIGDRGHDDTIHSARGKRDTAESPSNRNLLQGAISPVESIISPVQAAVHDHGPSPVSTEPASLYEAHGHASPIATVTSADKPSLLPLVEIIAPTPIMMSKELAASEELPRVELPKFDEMDKEDGIMGGVMPMSSTDSTESSDSNRTLKTELAGSTTSGSDTTVAPTAQVSPAIEEEPTVSRPLSSPAINRGPPRPDEVPNPIVPQRASPPQEWQESNTFPQLPPPLQRLARRISRGTPPISQPTQPPYFGMPMIPDPPPMGEPSLERYHTFQDAASFDYTIEDDKSLRRLSSITSLSSASSGLHGTIFPRPPSFVPNSANLLEQDLLCDQTTIYGPNTSASHQNQHHVHNRILPRSIVPPQVPPQAFSRPPPDSAISYSQSRRISRQSALADYSSAASVESGSSYGGGTSGASHVNRARGRSVAGSMLSSSSSGSHHRNLRAPPGPTFGYPNAPLAASPGMGPLPSQISSEQWDRGLLSNARSSESLGAVSAASGRSGGSGSSGGKGAGRALGGESIWTMGKEEEARWPPAQPSSSGHGHTNQSKAQIQYTLQSLVPQVEAPMSSEAASTILSSKDRLSSVHSGSQHSYELALPNDAFDSFYPSYNPYSLSPALETDRLRLPMQHSRSAPALPVYEGDQIQGAYKEGGRRRESRQSTLRSDWQDSLRYPDVDAGHLQDGLFSRRAPHVQLRAQAPPFAPISARYPVEHRLPPQASSRSLPITSPSDHRGTFDSRRNFEQESRMDSSSHPVSASSSRPSTARSALHVGTGAGDTDQYSARKSIASLPATGGVFPRYQEVVAPYVETTVVRPGSSGGRFKSLFKSRDSRVFKQT